MPKLPCGNEVTKLSATKVAIGISSKSPLINY
jgi:hypothetical protein